MQRPLIFAVSSPGGVSSLPSRHLAAIGEGRESVRADVARVAVAVVVGVGLTRIATSGQSSIGSQKPSESVSGSTASGGHAAPVPVHCSAMSHESTALRQIVVAGLN
jgi:hypothetical protein